MDIKSKLTSRKFWLAVANFVTMLLTIAFGKSENEAAQVTALIMAGAGVVAYIIGEGLVDAADAKTAIIQSVPCELEDQEDMGENDTNEE